MLRSRQDLDGYILAPLPNETEPENDILTVQARCIACGLGVEDKTATLLVHLQPCNHTYHIVCFQYACHIAIVFLGNGNTTLPYELRKLIGKFVACLYSVVAN